MKIKSMVIVLIAAILFVGCATKRYTLAPPISAAESNLMDCKDFQLEMVRADQIEAQINQTGELDMRSVAGFLGDFGIGNQMAKEEARTALAVRRSGIRAAQLEQGCIGISEAMADQEQPESTEVQDQPEEE